MFPKISVPLLLSDEKAAAAVDAAMAADHTALFLGLQNEKAQPVTAKDFFSVGTVCKIVENQKQPDGSLRLTIEGIDRVRVQSFVAEAPFFRAETAPFPTPQEPKTEQVEALMYSIVNEFKEAVNNGAPVPFDVLLVVMNLNDPWQLADLVALNIDFRIEEKQQVLEAATSTEKLERVSAALARQLKVLKLSKKLQDDTGKELGKIEKEMYLREQLKSIEHELGVLGGKSETEDLRTKIDAAGMTPEIKAIADKELARMQGMPSFSPEVSYIRTYLDWLVSLPWSKKTDSKIDVTAARRVLDEDHYGLEKVKERVLEYLAVQKLVGKIRGPILCFGGPPGTGKTSIGKSIARALGRKFVRISLGGVRDEAEIRGFRRTYVGALPGRIIQGIAQAGTRNPVFMLDEIDKLASDFKGDPSSALLEALDPEQNTDFSDHYLEAPFDLSDVLFLTTANVLDAIPPALRDRMEVIEFMGYTETEKEHIAQKHLLPKVLEMHGLTTKSFALTAPAVRAIIHSYTREAGVRNLERQLAAVCRKVAKHVATGSRKRTVVGVSDLKQYLGMPVFHHVAAEKRGEVGVVQGLAWTEAGGEILTIEAAKMPGSGQLTVTGNLGQVMQESARAAYSFARSYARVHGVKEPFYRTTDIHVHVPAGAIPKDGPSAGAAMATALVSLLTETPVKKGVAMTGEVTLRGRVLAIGGLKEKVLAAHSAGIRTVILPSENAKDMEEIPKEIRTSMRFVAADTMDQVLAAALGKPTKRTGVKKKHD